MVTEALDVRDVEAVAEVADVVQVGARNMQNYSLLTELGRAGRPVLLKRGLSATLDELLMAAEYVTQEGNPDVILCERGIRTFETAYRFTLDLMAVPVLKERSELPVVVDPSHAAGRRELVEPMSLAAAAAGADGVMVEVHPDPDSAVCDGRQSLSCDEFGSYVEPAGGDDGRRMRPVHLDHVRDQRIERVVPLIAPEPILDELPLTDELADEVVRGREEVKAVLDGDDDRLLVVVGPCSVHDPEAALEYAHGLAAKARDLRDDLCVVMRVYFEKPRTTTGWKGLINDPDLDGSGDVNSGLRIARRLLLEVVSLGLPVGVEWLDPITPQYISDTVAWGAIGARTTESQIHRQLGSGLSMPVGFKNGTDGSVKVAVDAVRAAGARHAFAGVDADGTPAILYTSGNPDCHVILRGGRDAPNYPASAVEAALAELRGAGLRERVIIDASHDNSGKDPERQPVRGRRHRGAAGRRRGRDRRRDARVLPGGRRPEARARRAARLRPVGHRRLHGLEHHRGRARRAGRRRAGPAQRLACASPSSESG